MSEALKHDPALPPHLDARFVDNLNVRQAERANGRKDPVKDPVETAAVGFEIDLRNLKMKQYRRWLKAAETNDLAVINEILAEIVVQWPYSLPSNDPASYDELGVMEYRDAVKAVAELLNATFHQA